MAFPTPSARGRGQAISRRLRLVRRLAIALPALFLALLELAREFYLEPVFSQLTGRLLFFGIMLMGTFAFAHMVFAKCERLEREIFQRNRHLVATNWILGASTQLLELDGLLHLALDRILNVAGLESGVIHVMDEEGREPLARASRGVLEQCADELASGKLTEQTEPGELRDVMTWGSDSRLAAPLDQLGIRALVAVPLRAKGTLHGVAYLGSRTPRAFTPLDLQLLRTTGGQIAIALENSWLSGQTRRQSEQLRSLNEIQIHLSAEHSLDALLSKIVGSARRLVDARYSALGVVEEGGKVGRFLTSGLDADQSRQIGAPPCGAGLIGLLMREARPLRLQDIGSHPSSSGFPPGHPAMKTFLGVPIRSRGAVLGCLYLTDKAGGGEFTEADEEAALVLAAQAAVAIENARLYERLQDLTRLRERDRIAMDLHDGVIQSIFAVGLNLEACSGVKGGVSAEVAQRLDAAINDLNGVIQDIRCYIFDLRPPDVVSKTFRQLLEDLLAELRVDGRLEVEIQMGELRGTFSGSEIRQLVQIAREAVANILKHARAQKARIAVHSAQERLILAVCDDGVGPPHGRFEHSRGQGLGNMERRAASLGGEFSIVGDPDAGTTVTVRVPFSASGVERV